MFDILNKYIVKREFINGNEHIYCTSKMRGKDEMKDDLISRKEAKDALTNSLMDDLPIKGNEKLVWNVGRFNNAICPTCCYDSKIRIDLLDWKYCPNCGTRLRKEHNEKR